MEWNWTSFFFFGETRALALVSHKSLVRGETSTIRVLCTQRVKCMRARCAALREYCVNRLFVFFFSFIFRSMHMPLICTVFRFSSFASLFFGLGACVSCSTQRRYNLCCSSVRTAMMPWHWSHFRWESLFFFIFSLYFFFPVLVFVSLISFISPAQNALHCFHYISTILRSSSVTKNRVYFPLVDSISRSNLWVDESTGRGVVQHGVSTDPVTHNITEHDWEDEKKKLVNHIIVDDRFSFYGALVLPNGGDGGDANRFS